MFDTQIERVQLAKQLALEGIVLLQNDGILPIGTQTKLAVFGKACIAAQVGGSGSGASRGGTTVLFPEAAEAVGLNCTEESFAFYQVWADNRPKGGMFGGGEKTDGEEGEEKKPEDFMKHLQGLVASGLIYELFGRYSGPADEPEVPAEMLTAARAATDTALLFIDRTAGGEECDRRVEDYHLLESEKALIYYFPHTRAFSNVWYIFSP